MAGTAGRSGRRPKPTARKALAGKPRRPGTPSPITSPFVTAGGSPLIMRWSAVTVCIRSNPCIV